MSARKCDLPCYDADIEDSTTENQLVSREGATFTALSTGASSLAVVRYEGQRKEQSSHGTADDT